MNTIYKRFFTNSYWPLFLLLFTLLGSCKKEYKKYPYADIISFTVKDANGEPLKAVVDAKNLTLYWPPNQALPDSIAPVITVSDRANVSPASGKKVAFKDNVKFTVTAQNGSTKEYLIKKVINQPLIKVSMLQGIFTYNGKDFAKRVIPVVIIGDNFIADLKQTKVFLVNTADNTEKEQIIANISPILITLNLDASTVNGTYKIKIVSGLRAFTIDRPFAIANEAPFFSATEMSKFPTALKPGQEFTLESTSRIGLINKISFRYLETRAYYEFTINEAKDGKLTLKVPDNIPLGEYYFLQFTYPGDEYYAAGTGGSILANRIFITN